MEIINLIAIVVIPIFAVLVAQELQNRSENRKDKMNIFKVLMTTRIYGWSIESVNCLNLIDIVFYKDKEVREAWKEFHDKCYIENPTETDYKKMKDARDKLLEKMAHSLGYKKITWETIQNPYIPNGMIEHQKNQSKREEEIEKLLKFIVNSNEKNNI